MFLAIVVGEYEMLLYTGSAYRGRERTVLLSVAMGGGLRLKDVNALYRNQPPNGIGTSGMMTCAHWNLFQARRMLLDVREQDVRKRRRKLRVTSPETPRMLSKQT